MKCVRSHVMKMLHRYTTLHVELRDLIGTSYTLEDYHQVNHRCLTALSIVIEQ